MELTRRSFLKSSTATYCVVLSAGMPEFSLAKTKKPNTGVIVLTLAEKVFSYLAGHNAKRAQALQQQAQTVMLKGLIVGLQEVTFSLEEILKQVEEIPDRVRSALLQIQDDVQRAAILADYQLFLGEKDQLLNDLDQGRKIENIVRYKASLRRWLGQIRGRSTLIMNLDREDRVEPVLIACLALRAELDISNELMGFKEDDLGLGNSLAFYQRFFESQLDEANRGSLIHQLLETRREQERLLSQEGGDVSVVIDQVRTDPNVSYVQYQTTRKSDETALNGAPYLSRRVVSYKLSIDPLTAYETSEVLVVDQQADCFGVMGRIQGFEQCMALYGKSNSVYGDKDAHIDPFNDARSRRDAEAIKASMLVSSIAACREALALCETALIPLSAVRTLQGGSAL
ncbi:MAG: hypothetical protein AAF636_08525 [Pseudomonadota bacterium]